MVCLCGLKDLQSVVTITVLFQNLFVLVLLLMTLRNSHVTQLTVTDLRLNYSIGLRLFYKHMNSEKETLEVLTKHCRGSILIGTCIFSGGCDSVILHSLDSKCCLGTQWYALSTCCQHLGVLSISQLKSFYII